MVQDRVLSEMHNFGLDRENLHKGRKRQLEDIQREKAALNAQLFYFAYELRKWKTKVNDRFLLRKQVTKTYELEAIFNG